MKKIFTYFVVALVSPLVVAGSIYAFKSSTPSVGGAYTGEAVDIAAQDGGNLNGEMFGGPTTTLVQNLRITSLTSQDCIGTDSDGDVIAGTCTGGGGGGDSFWTKSGTTLYTSSTIANVGVLTSAPSSTLHVVGTFQVSATSTFGGNINGGVNQLTIHNIRPDATDGLLLESANGTYVGLLGTANTANAVWYGSHNYDAATGNTIASFSNTKTLTSLATSTYPSLTELSYVKGVTSAIQTQIDGKQATGNYITALTGDVVASGPGSVAATIQADSVALTTDTTGNYVATLADDGQSTITVTNGSAEGGAATLRVVDVVCTDCLGTTEIADSYLLNNGDTATGNYDFSGILTAASSTIGSISTPSSTLHVVGTFQATGNSTFGGNIIIGGDTIGDFVGTGLSLSGTTLQTTLGTSVDLTSEVTGDLPFSSLAQGSALSVLGVTGNATADVASIAAGTDNQVLRRSGTALAFGAVNLASSDAVTGALPIANTALIAGDYLTLSTNTVNADPELASSTISFSFVDATSTLPYKYSQPVYIPANLTLTLFNCADYVGTSTVGIFRANSIGWTNNQNYLNSDIACGTAGNSTSTFATSTIPAGTYLVAYTTSTAGTPKLTGINAYVKKAD